MSFFDKLKNVVKTGHTDRAVRPADQQNAVNNSAPAAASVSTGAPAPSGPTTKAATAPASGRGLRNVLFVDDDAQELAEIERSLLPFQKSWQTVFAATPARTRELMAANDFQAVVASMRDPFQSVEVLNEVALRFPKAARFLRADPGDKELPSNFIQSPPTILAKTFDCQTVADSIERAFRLQAWAGSDSIQKLISRLERVPSVPALYTQVMAELAKPEASTQFIGRLIAKDPAMTAKILQMINSPTFGLARQITDPVEAVLHLGAESTKAMILLASVNLHFDKSGCPGFSHEQLWHHSMAVGAFARAVTMAQTKDAKLAEAAFTAGLLHDIGKLLLAANLSETYSQVLDQAQRRKMSVRDVEIEIFDASHAELAACVLGSWGLPISILEAIAWHHCPLKSDDQAFSILTAVYVANAVEHEKLLHQAGRLVPQIDSDYVERLGLADRRNAWRTACGFNVRVVDDTKKERFRLKQEAKEWEG